MKNSVWTLMLFAIMLPQIGQSQDNPDAFMRASVDVASQAIKEKTQYAQFISDAEDVFLVNAAIEVGRWELVSRVLKRYTTVEPHQPPLDVATLLAANDTLPGPVSSPIIRSASNGASWGQIGLLYGVQLIGKGSGSSGATTRMTYLEPMAYVVYSYVLPDNKGRVFGGLGPYLALGLWGQITSGTFSANPFDSQTGYGRFDAGLALTVGYQLPQALRLSLAHEIGLVNINGSNPDEEVYNRVWSLNVAYPLRKLVALVRKK